jgi:two-component system sensor histidine kinase BarA
MDIQMPVMSGIDTTRAIRSLESTLDGMRMPIIALTARWQMKKNSKWYG